MNEEDEGSVIDEPETIPEFEPEEESEETENEPEAPEGEEVDQTEGEADPDAGEEEAEEDQSKRNRPGKAQRRIARLEEQNRQLTQRFEDLLQRGNGSTDRAEQPQPAVRPTREQFQTAEDYIRADAAWVASQTVNQALSQIGENQKRQAGEAQRKEQADAFNERAEAFRDQHDDFDDVVSNKSLRITDLMAETIIESEAGPAVSYHLGNNPKEAERISKMSNAGQVRELVKLEAKLTAKPAKKVTNAKTPVKPLSGSGGAGVSRKDPSEMSMTEYAKWREAGNG